MSRIALFVLINVLMDMTSPNCATYIGIRDYSITGTLVGEYDDVRSFIACCVICEIFSTCNAANFIAANQVCQLININTEAGPLTPAAFQGCRASFQNLKDINPLFNASASHSNNHSHGPPHNALDGDTSGNYNDDSCTHAKKLPDQWWMVDFHGIYQISSVIIWNRLDNYYVRLRDLTISVANTTNDLDNAENICQTYTGPPSSKNENPIKLDCTLIFIGRYLRIKKRMNEALTLCEVQVLP